MTEENEKASSLHVRKLKELIDEYSKRNFEIFAKFKNYPLPRMVGDFRPDLIVKKGNQEIVIEIVSRFEMDKIKAKLEKLAEYADKTKDVRFDIVLTNPRYSSDRSTKDQYYRRLLRHIRQYLSVDVNATYNRGQYDAAFYLLYDLLKSLLEELAVAKGALPTGKGLSLREMNEYLRKSHLIDEDGYQVVKMLVVIRNRMVHGEKRPVVGLDFTHLLSARELAKALLKNLQR